MFLFTLFFLKLMVFYLSGHPGATAVLPAVMALPLELGLVISSQHWRPKERIVLDHYKNQKFATMDHAQVYSSLFSCVDCE